MSVRRWIDRGGIELVAGVVGTVGCLAYMTWGWGWRGFVTGVGGAIMGWVVFEHFGHMFPWPGRVWRRYYGSRDDER